MPDQDWTFGVKPKQLDRLLSLGLERADAEPGRVEPLLPSDGLIERPGGRVGRYRLLRILGEGGMGIVYLAEQQEPVKREVALKIIRPGMDSKRVLARFEAEQQALALMEHPYIARVYDAGLAPSGRPYFVMEHVDGIPITAYCDEHKLTIEERLNLFLHICEAVQHAHQKGIVHRDLKPSNILVTVSRASCPRFEGGTPSTQAVPKIIDFGVARAIGEPLTERTLFTEQGQLIGTPEYMSPEQADVGNQDVDTRTDVYSLGIILYELLAGVPPFDPKTFREGGIERIRKIIREEEAKTPSSRVRFPCGEGVPPLRLAGILPAKKEGQRQPAKGGLATQEQGRDALATKKRGQDARDTTESAERRRTDPRTLQRKLEGDLDWITLKAMEKDRTRRYATVDAMATDVRNYLSHQPVSAAPPGTLYRARKFARRHGQVLAASAMTVLLLIGGLATTTMYVRVAKEHTRAQAVEHRRALGDTQMLAGNGKYMEAMAGLAPLLSSPHVGREARLLQAKLILGGQGPAAAVPELQGLLDASDEAAGQARLLLANIYRESDPCTPAQADAYHQLWKDHLEQAELLIRGTPGYYFLLAQATHDVQKSLSLLEETLRLDQQYYDALRERAYIFQAQHDYEQMAEEARAMIVSRQESPQGLMLRAHAQREMGRFDEALHDYNDALRLDPNDPEIYDGRRETYARMGRYELALRDALKCAELMPDDPFYFYKPFLAYTILGQYDRAAGHYARFLTSPMVAGDYNPDAVPINASLYFAFFSMKSVFESRTAGQPWHGPVEPLHTGLYTLMYDTNDMYDQWRQRGRCIASAGCYCSWNPYGTKLAYSQGLGQGSLLTVLDLTTGHTEALISPGEDPAWSPDDRYMAFVKDRWLLPPDHLEHLHMRSWSQGMERQMATHAQEVWVMDMEDPDRPMRRIAAGCHPHWGRQSHRLYYYSVADNTLCSVSMGQAGEDGRQTTDGGAVLRSLSSVLCTPVLTDCAGPCPMISPDERFVADSAGRELRIVDLATNEVVETWTLPPPVVPPNLWVQWSPDGNELSLGAFNSDAGLWIYDRRTRTASKILDGGAAVASWSPDGRRLAVSLASVWVEVWLADLKPDRPTVESFDSCQTTEDHCRQLIERCNRWIEADPAFILAYDFRAECALWKGQEENATTYLQEFDRVLTAYDAQGCAGRAQHILRCPPEERDRLLPLARLFAQKAVAKDPNNPDYARILDAAQKAGAGESGL